MILCYFIFAGYAKHNFCAMVKTQNRMVKHKMATFNSTRKRFKSKWVEGLTHFNELNIRSQDVLASLAGSILNDNFHLIEFYTEKQVKYFTGESTFVWTKCHISALAVEEIIKNHLPCIEHYAVITHDKDISEPHTHVLVKFQRGERVASRLVEYLHIDTWQDCSYKLHDCVRYLTHDSDKCRKEGKYQYLLQEVRSDNIDYWLSFKRDDLVSPKDKTMLIIDDILSNKSYRYLCTTYGREFALNRDKWIDMALRIKQQEKTSIIDNNGVIVGYRDGVADNEI